jgi:hypothetical protein
MACGLPQQVVDSDRAWVYVLLHGDDHLSTGWDASWISANQAKRLLTILENDLENPVGYDLLDALRRRAQAGT